MDKIFIGTASWNIPTHLKSEFSSDGTHLEKYAQKFNCVEINSSFYKNHKFETYQKWSDAVPEDFQFSAKLLKYFTHEKELTETGEELEKSLQTISGLGSKLGTLLVQLPPSLIFNHKVVQKFFSQLKRYCDCQIVIEPRHVSWANQEALDLLEELDISKVLADPEPCKLSKQQRLPLEKRIRYVRLHGMPKIYKSNYEPSSLYKIKSFIVDEAPSTLQTWVIFDNTTYGYATSNAMELGEKLHYKSNQDISLQL